MPEWFAYVRGQLHLRGFRPEREAEIVEEVARQLEDAYGEALRLGQSRQEAVQAAEGHVADWTALARELEQSYRGRESSMTTLQNSAEDRDFRKGGRFSALTDLRQDVLFGLRVLKKSPGFTTVAVLTLALCIGANTSIFSIMNAVMLKSLPVHDPQHLLVFQWSARHSPKVHSSSSYGDCEMRLTDTSAFGCSLSKPFLEDVRKLGLFSGMAEFASAGSITVSGKGEAHHASGQYVSGDYFQTLGVSAAVGRVLTPNDDLPGAPAVVELQYSYWSREFGGDPSAVGTTIHLNGLPFTVVGVAEERFLYLTPGTVRDISVPMIQRRQLQARWAASREDAGSWWIVALARLKPGITRESAQSQVTALFANDLMHGEKPLAKPEDAPAITLLPAQTALSGVRRQMSAMLYALMLAVGIVLAIGCANVAGLQLARAGARRREIAIRQAVGAARGRLARQLLTESITLALVGAALGIVVAFWSSRALLAFAASNSGRPTAISADLDWRVLSFTIGAALLTGILFGLAPALGSMRMDLTPALRAGLTRGHGKASRFKLGNLLVVAQVALTMVVLVGAGLLVHTLQNLRSLDPGFATQKLLTFSVDATLTRYKGERRAQFYRDLQQRFSALPGVLSASFSESVLLSGSLSETDFHLPGTPPKAWAQADYLPVGPGFFDTMKIPMVKGRMLNQAEFALEGKLEDDPKAAAKVVTPAVVNEAFVKQFFATVDPIGRPFGANGPAMTGDPDTEETAGWTIVGVVRDAKYNNLRREVHPTMYVPSGDAGSFELRTAGDPESLVQAVRAAVRQAGPDLPIVGIQTQAQQIDIMLFQERLIARLASLFGLLSLLLASIGLYGLLAYEVTNATREIGIRVALGAPLAEVLRGVVRHGVTLTAIGVAIGIGAALAVTRLLGSMLFDVKPSDPLTLAGVTGLLLLVALAACYIPARRAARVNPLVALRHE
ncbi:MAG TPA: ABC transporter permease [Bryobacteraceae bacterium]|jgi:predicted permease|nr:ABC transporter permease [Bryobacteraceae bacterium]